MDIELVRNLTGRKKRVWQQFLASAGLDADPRADSTILIWDCETLVATGSRLGNLLKCIAVAPTHQGEGLTATLLTHLRQDAFSSGYQHLFLYTKPANEFLFSSLFFYPVVRTPQVLLMESKPNGIGDYLDSLAIPCKEGRIGALVMNCNPFTLGHRYLIETAAKECDWVYVFILSEEQPPFPAAHRLMLVKEGTQDLHNVTVLPTGPYLLSAATFPTYFLPDREQAPQIQCLLDIAVFTKYFIPKFGIQVRYVGTEPLSPMTELYNQALKEHLPITLREVPRLEVENTPVSASTVRSLMYTNPDRLTALVPQTTLNYLTRICKEEP